jgi:hypothetical protein
MQTAPATNSPTASDHLTSRPCAAMGTTNTRKMSTTARIVERLRGALKPVGNRPLERGEWWLAGDFKL